MSLTELCVINCKGGFLHEGDTSFLSCWWRWMQVQNIEGPKAYHDRSLYLTEIIQMLSQWLSEMIYRCFSLYIRLHLSLIFCLSDLLPFLKNFIFISLCLLFSLPICCLCCFFLLVWIEPVLILLKRSVIDYEIVLPRSQTRSS